MKKLIDKKQKKGILITLGIMLALVTIIGGGQAYYKLKSDKANKANTIVEELDTYNDFYNCTENLNKENSIIIASKDVEDYQGADSVYTLGDMTYLTYSSEEQAENALNLYKENGYTAEKDVITEFNLEELEEERDKINKENFISESQNVHTDSELESLNFNPITVAVLDSGINPDDEIKDRIVFKKRISYEDRDSEISATWLPYEWGGASRQFEDSRNHGTQIAKIIAENTNTNVQIASYNIIDDNGKIYTSALISAIYDCIAKDVKVINMSLTTRGYSEVLEYAIKDAMKHGIIVVAAAGNYGEDASGYTPANISGVITVGASDKNGNIADYSNYGEDVDCLADGNVYSADGSIKLQGTSYSAARVSGYISNILQIGLEANVLQTIDNVKDNNKFINTLEKIDESKIKYDKAYKKTKTQTNKIDRQNEDTDDIELQNEFSRFRHYYDVAYLDEGRTLAAHYDKYNDNKVTESNQMISNNIVNKLALINKSMDNQYDDTTIYGPYWWLPKGSYNVVFNFTPYGWHHWQRYDIGVNFAQQSVKERAWNDTSSYGEYGFSVYNIGNNGSSQLWYTIETDGDTADYELRTMYDDAYTTGIDTYLSSVSIEANYSTPIYFDCNGGSLWNRSTGTLSWSKWAQTRPSVEIPSRTGYNFDGWYAYRYATNWYSDRDKIQFDTSKGKTKIWNSSGNVDRDETTTEIMYSGYTVYADWSAKSYKVYFDANGGTIPANGNMGNSDIQSNYGSWLSSDRTNGYVTTIYNIGNFSSMTGDCPSRYGYTFQGWYDSDGNQVYNANGSCIANTGYWNTSGDWVHDGNVTLYAHWKANQHTAYFYPNKPSVASHNVWLNTSRKTITFGQKLGTLPTPSLTGWTFLDWKDSNGTPYASETTLLVDSDLYLYAQWTPNKYKYNFEVNYNPDGSKSHSKSTSNVNIDRYSQDVYYDYSAPLPEPTLHGWKFEGWYDSSGNRYTSSTIYRVLGNTTLYARWSQTQYKVRLSANVDATGNSIGANLTDRLDNSTEQNMNLSTYQDSNNNLTLGNITWKYHEDGNDSYYEAVFAYDEPQSIYDYDAYFHLDYFVGNGWYYNGNKINGISQSENNTVKTKFNLIDLVNSGNDYLAGPDKNIITLIPLYKINDIKSIDTRSNSNNLESIDYYRRFYTGQTVTYDMLMLMNPNKNKSNDAFRLINSFTTLSLSDLNNYPITKTESVKTSGYIESDSKVNPISVTDDFSTDYVKDNLRIESMEFKDINGNSISSISGDNLRNLQKSGIKVPDNARSYEVIFTATDDGWVEVDESWNNRYSLSDVLNANGGYRPNNGDSNKVYKNTEPRTVRAKYIGKIIQNNAPTLKETPIRIYEEQIESWTKLNDVNKEVEELKSTILKYQVVSDFEDNNDKLSNWYKSEIQSQKLRNSMTITDIHKGTRKEDGSIDYTSGSSIGLKEIINNIHDIKDNQYYEVTITIKDSFDKETKSKVHLYVIYNPADFDVDESNNINRMIYMPTNITGNYTLSDSIISHNLQGTSKEGLLNSSYSKVDGTPARTEEYEFNSGSIYGNKGSVKIIEY